MAKPATLLQPDHAAPNALLMALELRAPWELWSVLPTWPMLAKAPADDGHSLLVIPGQSASDGSPLPLPSHLKNLGYDVSGWQQQKTPGALTLKTPPR